MKRITILGLMLAALLTFGAASAAGQEQQSPELFSMEYGTVFGYDLNNNALVNGQEYAFLISLSPQIQAGASFIQGTGVLNANFLQLRYAMDKLAVNMKTGTYNGNLGYGVGGEFVALSKTSEGIRNRLVVSADYFVDSNAGFDQGTAAIGISFAMGM
jgi:hypothetical protein